MFEFTVVCGQTPGSGGTGGGFNKKGGGFMQGENQVSGAKPVTRNNAGKKGFMQGENQVSGKKPSGGDRTIQKNNARKQMNNGNKQV